MVESSRLRLGDMTLIVGSFILHWRHPAKGLQQAPVARPIDPFERREFDRLDVAPRTTFATVLATLQWPGRDAVVLYGFNRFTCQALCPGLGFVLRLDLDAGIPRQRRL